MAIPEDCVRTNIVWALPDNEIAVNTLNFHHAHITGQPLDWAGDMTQRYANLVKDGITSQWANIKAFHYQGVSIQRVDAYHLDTSGHALHKATALPDTATPLHGTASGGQLPPEVSLVLSLLAYDPAGFTPQSSRKRGRIYLPGIAQSLCNANGRVNNVSTVVNPWAAALSYMHLRQMGNNQQGVPDETAHLGVLSKTGGIFTDLVTLRGDDLFDVQRRRQNGLIPARATAGVS